MKKNLANVFFIFFILMVFVFKFPVYAEDKNAFTGWFEQITDDRMKEWTVQFNNSLNKDTITSNNIYIKDINGNLVETKLIVSKDGKTVTIKPILPYDTDKKYFIYITSKVKSSKNKNLIQEMKIAFIVKPKEDKDIGKEMVGYVTDKWYEDGSILVEVDKGETQTYKVDKGLNNISQENIIVFTKNSSGNIEVIDSSDSDFKIYKGKVKDIDGKYITILNRKEKNTLKFTDDVICYKEDYQKSLSSIESGTNIKVAVKDNLIQVIKIYENEDSEIEEDEDIVSEDNEETTSKEDNDEIVGYVVDRWNENGNVFTKIMYPEKNDNNEVYEKTYKVEKKSECISKDTIIVFKEKGNGIIRVKDNYKDFKMYAGEIKDIDENNITVYDCHDNNKHLLKLASNTICFYNGSQIKLSDLSKDTLIRVYVRDDFTKVIKIYD